MVLPQTPPSSPSPTLLPQQQHQAQASAPPLRNDSLKKKRNAEQLGNTEDEHVDRRIQRRSIQQGGHRKNFSFEEPEYARQDGASSPAASVEYSPSEYSNAPGSKHSSMRLSTRLSRVPSYSRPSSSSRDFYVRNSGRLSGYQKQQASYHHDRLSTSMFPQPVSRYSAMANISPEKKHLSTGLHHSLSASGRSSLFQAPVMEVHDESRRQSLVMSCSPRSVPTPTPASFFATTAAMESVQAAIQREIAAIGKNAPTMHQEHARSSSGVEGARKGSPIRQIEDISSPEKLLIETHQREEKADEDLDLDILAPPAAMAALAALERPSYPDQRSSTNTIDKIEQLNSLGRLETSTLSSYFPVFPPSALPTPISHTPSPSDSFMWTATTLSSSPLKAQSDSDFGPSLVHSGASSSTLRVSSTSAQPQELLKSMPAGPVPGFAVPMLPAGVAIGNGVSASSMSVSTSATPATMEKTSPLPLARAEEASGSIQEEEKDDKKENDEGVVSEPDRTTESRPESSSEPSSQASSRASSSGSSSGKQQQQIQPKDVLLPDSPPAVSDASDASTRASAPISSSPKHEWGFRPATATSEPIGDGQPFESEEEAEKEEREEAISERQSSPRMQQQSLMATPNLFALPPSPPLQQSESESESRPESRPSTAAAAAPPIGSPSSSAAPTPAAVSASAGTGGAGSYYRRFYAVLPDSGSPALSPAYSSFSGSSSFSTSRAQSPALQQKHQSPPPTSLAAAIAESAFDSESSSSEHSIEQEEEEQEQEQEIGAEKEEAEPEEEEKYHQQLSRHPRQWAVERKREADEEGEAEEAAKAEAAEKEAEAQSPANSAAAAHSSACAAHLDTQIPMRLTSSYSSLLPSSSSSSTTTTITTPTAATPTAATTFTTTTAPVASTDSDSAVPDSLSVPGPSSPVAAVSSVSSSSSTRSPPSHLPSSTSPTSSHSFSEPLTSR
jgi:hypothetical protein